MGSVSATCGLKLADGRVVARRLASACRFWERGLGLLLRSQLDHDEALWLEPGGSVHTFGMRFPIDLVFLDQQHLVLAKRCHVAPWRVRWAPRGTRTTVEFAAGHVDTVGLDVGDKLTKFFGVSNHADT